MKIFSVLQQSFGFTRNEIKVILFLITTFIVGLGIRWFSSTGEPEAASESRYDYSLKDQEFEERSKKLAELTSPKAEKMTASKQALEPHSININTASKEQLILLPGIGETYAERIIIYRDNNGPYTSIDELENVRGIGKHTLERLRPFIRVK